MNDTEVIDGEVVAEHDTAIAVREAAPITLFGTDDPVAVIEKATRVARALADVIEEQNLYTTISGKKHIRVEGWTLLGSMLGVFPETEWTRRVADSKGAEAYEARVVARTRDGAIVGAREAMCSRSEARWKNADDYAIRSMAQTRAVSGALAAPLRFIVVLAGYEGTPEAEMTQSNAPTGTERRVNVAETKVPRTWEEIESRLKSELGDSDALVWYKQAAAWAKDQKGLQPTALQRMAAIICDLEEAEVDLLVFPPVGARAVIQGIMAKHLDGTVLAGPPWCMNGEDPDEKLLPSRAEVLGEKGDES